MKHFFKPVLLVSISVIVFACANRGMPQGGRIDTEPPKIKKASPENNTTNFKGNEIEIIFDEYIKIKDAQKQLIISPPMDIPPDIYPLGGASESIKIKIKDTLQPNTTYAFNFGESIVDNNEENPFSYFRYVFSTGSEIDSLSIKGYITDAIQQKPDPFISVHLYEVDSAYNDSLVYKQKPRYITNTLDSVTNFSIDNIKAGTYKLVALLDDNTNYKFDQKFDKIGFVNQYITIPTDSVFRLNIFKETTNFKMFRPKQASAQRIMFPYEGEVDNLKIKMLTNGIKNFKYRLVKNADTDTINYWYAPKLPIDSTKFVVTKNNYIDTLMHRFRTLDNDSLVITAIHKTTLNFEDPLVLQGNIPFETLNQKLATVIDADTIPVKYTVSLDSLLNRYMFNFEKQSNQNYTLKLLPNALTDMFGNVNKDTLSYKIRTKNVDDLGNLRVELKNAKYPLIVQLINTKDEVYKAVYTAKSSTVDFTNITPGKYALRAVFDSNKNGKFDTGDFLKGLQPERVSYSNEVIEIRASFDNIITFRFLN